jgi:RNA-directed DNA polymerase
MENRFNEGKQMTTEAKPPIGAPSARGEALVKRLQMRIAKAIRENRHGKAKALQWLLTHSHYGKQAAVKRVTRNKGAKTPGIDGVTWKTQKQKEEAVKKLKRRGYKAQPLRRIYIPKKDGKRPLGIPTMADRAQQALHLLGLLPIAEMKADRHAYGFRPLRCTADAIEQCFKVLARKTSARWILEGDIKSCFDRISHEWLMANIPMDKAILKQWLKSGYLEGQDLHPTTEGTPQGAIISPTLLVLTLSGLEQAVKKAVSKADKVHVVIYADDFIITGASKEVLQEKISPALGAFLNERGLELSQAKTKISTIEEGFDFLGFNVRKYNGKLLIKPSKNSIKRFLGDIREIIRKHVPAKTENLIRLLNPKIRGWANYFRHVVSKEVFGHLDKGIFEQLVRWIKRRHPNKGAGWWQKRYFRTKGLQRWVFFARAKNKRTGESQNVDLIKASSVPIKRHIKIRAAATPFDPVHRQYLAQLNPLREDRTIEASMATAAWLEN